MLNKATLLKNKILILVIIILGLSFLSTSSFKEKGLQKEYKATSYAPQQLADFLKQKDKYVVIDVRTKDEYDKGHIPGAVHAPYYDTKALKKAAGDKIPVTYCAYSAMRGPYAAYQLYQAGYKNVAVLEGGVSAWAEENLDLKSVFGTASSVFTHPPNIFPERERGNYPKGQGNVKFNIIARMFEFVPNKIVVKHGQKVTLNIVSEDVTHGFALPEYGIEEELLPKEPITITFVADRRGNFPFVCSVICGAVHSHASMVGNLIVK
jgi:cytochrome c oxidase subunit 2